MFKPKLVTVPLLVALAALPAAPVAIAQSPAKGAGTDGTLGVWYDDTGEGAVEIVPCGDRLCGRIIWLKSPTDKTGAPLTDALNPQPAQRQRPICNLQVIGDLQLQPGGAWDAGWIYDPKEGKSYNVELRLRGPDRLQVKGYIGTKLLSESFIWTRAPANIKRCSV
jgi:uncharacterized protein (DUF2147 family)